MKLQLDISELFAALLGDETHATALQLAWWLGLVHHEPMPLPVAHVGTCIPLHPLGGLKPLFAPTLSMARPGEDADVQHWRCTVVPHIRRAAAGRKCMQ